MGVDDVSTPIEHLGRIHTALSRRFGPLRWWAGPGESPSVYELSSEEIGGRSTCNVTTDPSLPDIDGMNDTGLSTVSSTSE